MATYAPKDEATVRVTVTLKASTKADAEALLKASGLAFAKGSRRVSLSRLLERFIQEGVDTAWDGRVGRPSKRRR